MIFDAGKLYRMCKGKDVGDVIFKFQPYVSDYANIRYVHALEEILHKNNDAIVCIKIFLSIKH